MGVSPRSGSGIDDEALRALIATRETKRSRANGRSADAAVNVPDTAAGVLVPNAAAGALVLDDLTRLTALLPRGISYHFAWDSHDALPQPRLPVADVIAARLADRHAAPGPSGDAPVALSGTLRSTRDKHELLSGTTRDLTGPPALTLPTTELFELVDCYIPSDNQDHFPVCFHEAVVVGPLRPTPDGTGLEMPEVDEVSIQLPDVVVRFVNAED